MKLAIPRRVGVVLAAALVVGCAVDTDALVCGPGRSVRDGVCRDVVPAEQPFCAEFPGDVSMSVDASVGGRCTSWYDCPPDAYCAPPGVEDLRLCQLRCDAANAAACPAGATCSAAGLCLVTGALQLGEDCSAAQCGPDLACAVEDALCHAVCDPRSDDPACEEGSVCIARDSGLGLCLPACD